MARSQLFSGSRPGLVARLRRYGDMTKRNLDLTRIGVNGFCPLPCCSEDWHGSLKMGSALPRRTNKTRDIHRGVWVDNAWGYDLLLPSAELEGRYYL